MSPSPQLTIEQAISRAKKAAKQGNVAVAQGFCIQTQQGRGGIFQILGCRNFFCKIHVTKSQF